MYYCKLKDLLILNYKEQLNLSTSVLFSVQSRDCWLAQEYFYKDMRV